MKKRFLSCMLVALIVFAQSVVALPILAKESAPQIKNIIYMIADGGGYALYDLANEVKIRGGLNEEKHPYKTPTDSSPLALKPYLAGSMITLINPTLITDSAAAATAMSTGFKTGGGRLGVDVNSKPKANLIEAAESVGKATGVISTYEWQHATPAGFAVHVMSRNDYYNIYQQMENRGLEVVMGSGYGMVSEYATIENAAERGYLIAESKSDLNFVQPGDKIWGNFVETNFPYDINLQKGQPTLAEMTKAAITALSGDEDGFFLMVEGGKVDNAAHLNNALGTTSEYLAFDEAFRVALEFAKGRTDTVIVCAPDHDTGAMVPPKYLDVAVKVIQNGSVPAANIISWGTTDHSAQNVGVWMYVPEGVSVIEGLNPALGDTPETRANYVIDNTAIAPWCASLMGVDLGALTKELFIDVTDLGVYDTQRKFTFNSENKYIYANQSVYYENGVKKSLGYKLGFEVGGRFYVPREMVDISTVNIPSNDNAQVVPDAPAPIVTSVTVSPKNATLNKGEALTIDSFVRGEGNFSKEIVWTIEGEVSQGTYIARDGFLYISPSETAESFYVMAKSKESGNIADSCFITVGSNVNADVTPNGSRERPFLISSEDDFLAFTEAMISGEKYNSVHFKQTANLDLSKIESYKGVGSAQAFNGIYDGNGYTINIAIDSDADGCLFPYTSGVIMNLGVTGSVTNKTYTGAICRSLRSGGTIINCWSDAAVTGRDIGGIAWTNYGVVSNCYFSGSLAGTGVVWPIAQNQSGAKTLNNYYLGSVYFEEEAAIQITASHLKNDLSSWLNRDMEESISVSAIPYSMKKWSKGDISPCFAVNEVAQEKPEWKNPFTDVNTNDWFYDGVKFVNENGFMNGVNAKEFAPGNNLTRAMLVTVLYRLEGSPSVFGGLPFSDVEEGSYYEFAVAWAKNNGIVNGTTETTFSPNVNLTREQIAAIMHRFAKYKGIDVSVGENTNILSYDDFFEISEYAIPSLQWTSGSGLMKGKSESTLNPKDYSTRAEIAAILNRFIETVIK